ncbi:chorismate transformation enzyme, FkbO/Hyg5 family [Phycisphaera mikurensis]|uniref:chorismate transformation enzyme, FkbO/Hyg5 family n=1 Tax=Phycisphaera mikurensis TaxID=547188 RepID=UPI0012B5346D|nr:pteridine-dependent deoxygenase [Phycisphaera mikurensis]
MQPAPGHSLVEAVAPAADTADPAGLQDATRLAYRRLLRRAADARLAPLRFWNYVPGITEPAGDAAHRYMVFNAGRAAGMAEAGFAGRRVAASAVGFPGDADAPRLTVQMLAGPAPAEPAENPRQVPAWRYSDRFGDVPPAFARAARLPASAGFLPGALLLAGTASVVGEESLHPGDLAAQAAETCTNLAVLLAAGAGRALAPGAAGGEEDVHLARLRDLRVYVKRAADLPAVGRMLQARCPAASVSLMHAEICRPELLLEAEGVSSERLAEA